MIQTGCALSRSIWVEAKTRNRLPKRSVHLVFKIAGKLSGFRRNV